MMARTPLRVKLTDHARIADYDRRILYPAAAGGGDQRSITSPAPATAAPSSPGKTS
ncbi:MAG: hypothetical protein OXP69_07225 [Spirochaetaceae bacterium]|nr:hypothetical protein [Spirochaetaceae bacterium]